jgi:hypothetical protein
MAGSMTFLAGVLPLVIWTNTKNYGVLIFFVLVEGLVAGNFWATIAPLVAEVVGLENVPCGLNLIWLVIAIPCTFSEPIALEIFSGTGSYLGTQLFTGSMYVAAAGCMLALRGWKIAQITQTANKNDTDKQGTAAASAMSHCAGEREKIRAEDCLYKCFKWANV